jgi:hypothetical protein
MIKVSFASLSLTSPKVLLPIGLALALLALPSRGRSDESCPSTNACNNSDGCGGSLQDQIYWVHWYGISRQSNNDPNYYRCKDRYHQVNGPSGCTQGSYVGCVQEVGCNGNNSNISGCTFS